MLTLSSPIKEVSNIVTNLKKQGLVHVHAPNLLRFKKRLMVLHIFLNVPKGTRHPLAALGPPSALSTFVGLGGYALGGLFFFLFIYYNIIF